MPRSLLVVEGSDHDVTNLLCKCKLSSCSRSRSSSCSSSGGDCGGGGNSTIIRSFSGAGSPEEKRVSKQALLLQQALEERLKEEERLELKQELAQALYPCLQDPLNLALLQDVESFKWENVSLMKDPVVDPVVDPVLVLEQPQQKQVLPEEESESERMLNSKTGPVCSWTKELYHQEKVHQHRHSCYIPSMPASPPEVTRPPRLRGCTATFVSNQMHAHAHAQMSPLTPGTPYAATTPTTPTETRRRPFPRLHRNRPPTVTTASASAAATDTSITHPIVAGDIDSNSSGLRPKLNYKSLYSHRTTPLSRRTSSGTSKVSLGAFPTATTTTTTTKYPNLKSTISGYSDVTEETAALEESAQWSNSTDIFSCSYRNSAASAGLPAMRSSSSLLEPTKSRPSSLLSSSCSKLELDDDSDRQHERQINNDNNAKNNTKIRTSGRRNSASISQRIDSNQMSSSSSSSSSSNPSTMEIAPNVRVPVRSSRETYEAVHQGQFTVVTCFVCAETLVCTNQAAFVLCPDCRVVSPIMSDITSDHNNNNDNHYKKSTMTTTTTTTSSAYTQKDGPGGIGTGLKREWIDDDTLCFEAR